MMFFKIEKQTKEGGRIVLRICMCVCVCVCVCSIMCTDARQREFFIRFFFHD